MVIAGYAGAVGLFSAAGIFAVKATIQRRFVSHLERAMKNDLPDKEGKTSYVVLECLGSPHSFPLLPEGVSALIGRVHIQKHTSHIDLGIGATLNSKSDWVITATPRDDTSAVQMGFQEPAVLNSSSGPVVMHHLDLATWIGARKEVHSYTPKEAAIPLRTLGMQPDLLVDQYQITVEGFEETKVFIFADAEKREDSLHVNPPLKNLPFLVITEDPKLFLPQERLKADRTKTNAKISALGSISFATGTRTFQHFKEMLYYQNNLSWGAKLRESLSTPKYVRLFGYTGVCAISSAGVLYQSYLRIRDQITV